MVSFSALGGRLVNATFSVIYSTYLAKETSNAY